MTLSIVVWYDVIRWAFDDRTTVEVSTPRAARPSISSSSTRASTTTPLAITGMQPGVSTPEGSRWVANFSPLTTMVWPALFPP